CGTKVLRRSDYDKLAANRSYFGDFDPFGDFDLLFGAAKLGLEIVAVPVRYRERTYGTTNIQRWRHGWLLLKMCLCAAGRIKFVGGSLHWSRNASSTSSGGPSPGFCSRRGCDR